MKTTFLASALALVATGVAAESYTTKSVTRGDLLTRAEARALLPAPYTIGAIGCPVVPHASGQYLVSPPIALAMRTAAQSYRAGPDIETREVEVEGEDGPEIVEVEFEVEANTLSAKSFGIGDVLFTLNAMTGSCDAWSFSPAS